MNRMRHFTMALLASCLASCAAARAEPPAGASEEIYLVPFSHLDLYWGGTREECLARGNDLIAKAIRQAKQSPQFRFLLEDNDFIANYLDSHRGSQEVQDLKQLVREGRIEVAPKWAAIYQELCDGEAWARNLVIGKRYAQEVFGVEPQVAHLGDIPGYTLQFPQLLQQTKIPFMLMARMGPSDTSLFYWQSPNGSRALVWASLKHYGWGSALGIHRGQPNDKTRERFHKDVADVRATTRAPIFMHFGSDLWAPPENLADAVQAFNAAAPARLKLATPTEFFRLAQQTPEIPTLSGEIPSSWPNLIPSWPHLWPLVVPAVNTLLSAEKFSALNHALDYADYPQQELVALWKRLLEAMDHNQDGQGGFGGDVRKLEHIQQSLIVGGQILRDMLRNIAERVQIPVPDSFPIVVFNPMGWTRDDVVRTHVALFGPDSPANLGPFRNGARLVDETGKNVPFFEEQSSSNISRTMDIVFVAKGVPSLGYKTYFLVPPETDTPAGEPTAKLALDAVNDQRQPRRPLGNDVIQNAFYRLTIDRATGRVTLFDKALACDVCRDMEVNALEERGGNYIGIEPLSGRTIVSVVEGIAVEENNPVRAVVRIDLRIADILVTQRLTLYRDIKRLDIENTVDWNRPRFVRVRQVFPLVEPNPVFHYGVPFGANVSDNVLPNSGPHMGDEIKPESWRGCRFIQGWIHAGTAERGMTLAADHQLVRLEDGAITGEMVRGTRFTSAKVVRGEEVGSMQYPPPGKYLFRFSLTSDPRDWKAAKAYRAGLNWINPLMPVQVIDAVSTKSLPPTLSFCSFTANNLVLSTLKKADAGAGLVLRVYEIEGRPASGAIDFLGRTAAFTEVNVLEETVDATPRQAIQASPFAIKTFHIAAPGRETP